MFSIIINKISKNQLMKNIKNFRGIEREMLRVNSETGRISQKKHPLTLGEKLTNESITVDYSENLLELITKPHDEIKKTFDELKDLSSFTLQNMDSEEHILNASMPVFTNEDEINIADFGTSNQGMIKEVYRNGLAIRYGKIMQIIAGIHYNFSFDPRLIQSQADKLGIDFSDVYFGVINNYFEIMWILPYLFGASPICAKTSVHNKPDYLEDLDSDYFISKYSTSLRMSDLGYVSHAQKDMNISYNNVSEYVGDLVDATQQEYPIYQAKGLYDKNNNRQQLNNCILQMENEYYSSIRPKQIAKSGERPLCALLKRGIKYIEVRVLDVNPFNPLGIDKDTAHFVEAMLNYCLFTDFRKYSHDDFKRNNQNFNNVAIFGRKPNLHLIDRKGNEKSLKELGLGILTEISKYAQEMPKGYFEAVEKQKEKFLDSSQTPSAKLIQIAKDVGSYEGAILEISKISSKYLRNIKLDRKTQSRYEKETQKSILDKKAMEKSHCCDFETYIDNYYKTAYSYCD